MLHQLYAVSDVEIVAPYTLKLTFDDGTKKTINFRSVLEGELFGPLQDLAMFNAVRLDTEVKTIVWPNGADFDPATLHDWNIYEQEIVARIQQHRHAAESQTPYGTPPE